jgi:hypothetical protein
MIFKLSNVYDFCMHRLNFEEQRFYGTAAGIQAYRKQRIKE